MLEVLLLIGQRAHSASCTISFSFPFPLEGLFGMIALERGPAALEGSSPLFFCFREPSSLWVLRG